MTVRHARPEDWPAVRDLLIELGRPDPGDAGAAHRAGFEGYLAREDAAALVAEDDDGTVVGFVNVEFRRRLNFASPQAWVPDLIVADAVRSRGIGSALLARVEEIAKARGAWGITLESASWRTRAHAFYEREGWAASGASFVKSLDGTPWPPTPR